MVQVPTFCIADCSLTGCTNRYDKMSTQHSEAHKLQKIPISIADMSNRCKSYKANVKTVEANDK